MLDTIDLPEVTEYHLDKLRATSSQLLGQTFTDEVLITRALQHYRIMYLHIANRIMSFPAADRKLETAKVVDAELERLNQTKEDCGES